LQELLVEGKAVIQHTPQKRPLLDRDRCSNGGYETGSGVASVGEDKTAHEEQANRGKRCGDKAGDPPRTGFWIQCQTCLARSHPYWTSPGSPDGHGLTQAMQELMLREMGAGICMD
jgi:hypothetical protein